MNALVIPATVEMLWGLVLLAAVTEGKYGVVKLAPFIPVITFVIFTYGIVQLYSWGKEINKMIVY